jgi:PEP-CTERM motif
MFAPRKILITTIALLLSAVPASSSTLYILTGPPGASGELFGTIDTATGAFTQIGPGTEGSTGLVSGPNGQVLSLGFDGNLNSINPVTGATTLIGPTGLVDCSDPFSSPCGPQSANVLGSLGGQIYATDFDNRLYQINSMTGLATLIGPTGVPALPFTPISTNPDNTFNAYDETLFGANGNLYATFDAFTVSLDTFTLASIVIPPKLYQIDPNTGATTLLGPTDLFLGAATATNGLYYAFNDGTSQIVTLDLATGHTTSVTGFDPGIGIVTGAVAATPEPASIALTALGLAGLAFCARRKEAL